VPFKSEAQKAKFAQMVKEGKMSQATFDEWNKETPSKLPERVDSRSKKIKKTKTI
jgi:hypothetical protein